MSEPEPTADMVRAAHVLSCESYSIAADGTAMMVFHIRKTGPDDDGRFAITMPTGGLKAFRTLVSDLIAAVDKRGLSAGMATMHRPREVTVGHSDHLRGCAAVSFNPGADDEAVFLLPDELALQIADAIQRDVFGRMTEKDRRAHIAKQSRLLTPGRPTILLPGLGDARR